MSWLFYLFYDQMRNFIFSLLYFCGTCHGLRWRSNFHYLSWICFNLVLYSVSNLWCFLCMAFSLRSWRYVTRAGLTFDISCFPAQIVFQNFLWFKGWIRCALNPGIIYVLHFSISCIVWKSKLVNSNFCRMVYHFSGPNFQSVSTIPHLY